MRKMGIAAFTNRGRCLADRVAGVFGEQFEVIRYEHGLKSWCGRCFVETEAIVFVGACGIAVRTIAPWVKDKTRDPAVLVLDEKGQFVISLLSGHLGGANELARLLADRIGAVPVITTASDVNGMIAVDVFARQNHLTIGSMEAAKRMAAAILKGERAGVYCCGQILGQAPPELCMVTSREEWRRRAKHLIWISPERPDPGWLVNTSEACSGGLAQQEDREMSAGSVVLHLIPKAVTLGIGCRRMKDMETIRRVAEQVLERAGIVKEALLAVGSIDLKAEEPGILELCRQWQLPFETWSAAELLQVPGEFTPSEFVRQTTGVDNVCERAALLAAGSGSRLIAGKYAENGVTAALAVREWRIRFEE